MNIDISNKSLEGLFDIDQYCKDNDIDVEKVTKLNCYNNELTELKGLDKLVNLNRLDCVDNKLTELDLSKLVNLKELHCQNNELTELKGLDELVNLKWLYCQYNQLTELKGLDKLVNLEGLHCQNNQLTYLDLSKLVNLRWLNNYKYTQPEPDKLDLILNQIEKMEKDIAKMKEIYIMKDLVKLGSKTAKDGFENE